MTAHITSPSITSPVSTAAKIIHASSIKTTTASSEPDVAFPAVLKGSQKQRVPPPVPPRGSPKAKRGGANSQSSSLDAKGDVQNSLEISMLDIPAPTPITSSDEDFKFIYGHGFKLASKNVDVACRLPTSVSEHSFKITKLLDSNSFLDYVEEGDSITERSHPGKDLIAQTTMMAKFNIDRTVREHLDSGDYDDPSFTESSSEERIIIHFNEDPKGRKTKSPSEFIKETVSNIEGKLIKKTRNDIDSSSERLSVHNVRSTDLLLAAKSLKKISNIEENQLDDEKPKVESKEIKIEPKQPGIISGLTKRLTFNQSKREKYRKSEVETKKIKAKVEIKTYTEEHSKGMNKDEVICHHKAKTKIDLFQKHILKVQSDSENSSRRSSLSSQDSKRPTLHYKNNNIARKHSDLVSETKRLFEPITYSHGSQSSSDNISNYSMNTTAINPIISSSITGNVHDKIKKFSNITPTGAIKKNTERIENLPKKIPRQKKVKKTSPKTKTEKIFFRMRKDIEDVL